jgi:hypothetical protein
MKQPFKMAHHRINEGSSSGAHGGERGLLLLISAAWSRQDQVEKELIFKIQLCVLS